MSGEVGDARKRIAETLTPEEIQRLAPGSTPVAVTEAQVWELADVLGAIQPRNRPATPYELARAALNAGWRR